MTSPGTAICRRHTRDWILRLGALAALGLLTAIAGSPHAASAQPPFGLPFASAPGPSTWYVSQWYGNTVWAYRNWPDLYAAGQGLHFGVDFAAPCGTPVVAIGDGVVFAVDGPYGAAPHNLVIDHQNGYLSLYGHLRERAPVAVGQRVQRGETVAFTGDPAGGDCTRAPHLHLEIRRPGMASTVNPLPLIAADWRSLTIGAHTDGSRFALDYTDPARWQMPTEQPDVQFGAGILNDFGNGWPPR